MNNKNILGIGLLALFTFLSFAQTLNAEREIKVRPPAPAYLKSGEEEQIADLETVSKESEHYERQKAFIGELRAEAGEFRAGLAKITDPDEREQKLEEFRVSRAKKIDRFLSGEKATGTAPNQQDKDDLIKKAF